MLKVLLKKQMTEMFRGLFYDQRKKAARSRGSTALWILLYVFLFVGVLGGIFAAAAFTMCGPLTDAGAGWLYFAVMSLIALMLGVFGSVFNTSAALYLPKDNDLLLSMPIPAGVIIASRLLGVYITGLMYSGTVLLPAVIIYLIFGRFSVLALLGGIVLIAVVSLLVLVLSCALGFVVAKISVRLKNKSIVTVILSLVFIGVYYFVYFKAQTLMQTLIANASYYGEKIKGSAWVVYFFGRVGEGNPAAMAVFAVLTGGVAALTMYLLSKSFFSIAAAAGAAPKATYKEKQIKAASAATALVRREFARFFSSPNYMLNCGLGVLLLPAAGVAMLLKGELLLSVLSGVFEKLPGTVPVLFAAAACMLASMNDIAAPAVSLEGKALWLVKSLPVSPAAVLKAKLAPQLILTLPPVLFCYACGAAVLRGQDILTLVLGGFTVLAYTLLSSVFGLFLGLKMPVLDWTNEAVPIKQSMGVTIALFSGWGYALLLGGGWLLLGAFVPAPVFLGVFFALTLAAAAGLYRWIVTKGAAVFEGL